MFETLRGLVAKLTMGTVVVRGSKIQKGVLVGLVGVIMAYGSVAGIVSVATPWWLGVGDTPRHIDYAWSVYNLHLPTYDEGLQYPVFNQLRGGQYSKQNAAKNPPLFYVIHAPFMGPLMKSGHWHAAIAVGRFINIILGVLCIMALAWAGWLYGGRIKNAMAVSVPAIASLTYDFTVLNQNFASDVLLVLLSTLTIVNWYKLINNGLRRRYVASLILLSILGMATKGTYIVFLVANVLALFLAALLYVKGGRARQIYVATKYSALLGLGVLVAIGWYYVRNRIIAGSWYSNGAGGAGGRVYKSLHTVITSSTLWGMFYTRLSVGKVWSTIWTVVSLVAVIEAVLSNKLSVQKNKKAITLCCLIGLSVLGIFLTQLVWAIGYGGFYFRYFLPVIGVFGLVISYGLLQFCHWRGQLVTILVSGMTLLTVKNIPGLSSIKAMIPESAAAHGVLGKLSVEASHNGIPAFLAVCLVWTAVFGVLIIGWSRWYSRHPEDQARVHSDSV